MNKTYQSDHSLEQLSVLIEKNINSEFGKKVLEFGSCGASAAQYIYDKCDYLALTDKSKDFPENFRLFSEVNNIATIPDSELGEDCYFGRFHLVYTLFGFRELPRLVDEVMRLRRLIIKGGKIAIIDYDENGTETDYKKQLKRCGFENISAESFTFEEKQAFLITAEK